jgi:putative membrane protein
MTAAEFIPYCGAPPLPGGLRWNLDPFLITALLVVGVFYAAGCRHARRLRPREHWLFGAGLLIAAAALITPLCNLSVALFSARVTQHVVLILIAAPLLVLGRFDAAIAALLPHRAGDFEPTASSWSPLTVGGIAFAIALWTWHLPGPYDATLQNNVAYWAMHATTFGAALLLWHGLLHEGAGRIGAAMAVGFITGMQMSLLGAVLTLSPRSLFAVHAATTWPWGLSPLEDQQLGGLIMWVPAGLLFTAYAVIAFGIWLNRLEAPVAGTPAGRRDVAG